METSLNGTQFLEEEMYHRRRAPKHVQGRLIGSSWTTYCRQCQGPCREPEAHRRSAAHFMQEWSADPSGRCMRPMQPILSPQSEQDHQYSAEQWERWRAASARGYDREGPRASPWYSSHQRWAEYSDPGDRPATAPQPRQTGSTIGPGEDVLRMFGSRRGLGAGRMSGLGGAGPPRPQPAREMGGAEAPQVEFAEDSRSQAMGASSAEGEDQEREGNDQESRLRFSCHPWHSAGSPGGMDPAWRDSNTHVTKSFRTGKRQGRRPERQRQAIWFLRDLIPILISGTCSHGTPVGRNTGGRLYSHVFVCAACESGSFPRKKCALGNHEPPLYDYLNFCRICDGDLLPIAPEVVPWTMAVLEKFLIHKTLPHPMWQAPPALHDLEDLHRKLERNFYGVKGLALFRRVARSTQEQFPAYM